jgi:molybdopterin synthase catalytic subunit
MDPKSHRMIALVHHALESYFEPYGAEQGAEVQFIGIVRETEAGSGIAGIRYSAYEAMALRLMEELHTSGIRQHGPHDLVLVHRLGLVAARESSILIRVRTKHSALSFDLCRHYLHEMKTTVPIWKEIVPA